MIHEKEINLSFGKCILTSDTTDCRENVIYLTEDAKVHLLDKEYTAADLKAVLKAKRELQIECDIW